jgi:hypothetical protein
MRNISEVNEREKITYPMLNENLGHPYPDAKVAEKLCGSSPCLNESNPKFTVMNSMILSCVVSIVKKGSQNQHVLCFGRH